MNQRKKLVYLSSVAVPHQIVFANALQEYYDAKFWFYETPDRTRGAWWHVDLGANCKILQRVLFSSSGPLESRYVALDLADELSKFDPDIVVLGGFSIPSNYMAYLWARRRGKKTVVFCEHSRDARGVLRKRSLVWKFLRWLYRDVDLVMVSSDDAVIQYRDEFDFGSRVVAARYAADIEAYFHHPLRLGNRAYTYLFANRMTEIYNPIAAIEIFAAVREAHPESKLVMNATGELDGKCRERIAELGIGDSVEFLSDIASWSELHRIYARCDVLLLPANFSNGNFTILEAAASGMGMVISNRILGIGSMIEDGVNGFRCEPTRDAFLSRIKRYISEPHLFEAHASINRTLAKPYSASGTAGCFHEILSKRFAN